MVMAQTSITAIVTAYQRIDQTLNSYEQALRTPRLQNSSAKPGKRQLPDVSI